MTPHPTDTLILDIIAGYRAATAEAIARIVEHVASASFMPALVRTPLQYRGLEYMGRRVAAWDDPLFLHLVEHVAEEQQWRLGTGADEYLTDLRAAVRWAASRLAVYNRRGGQIVAVVAPTHAVVPITRRGPGSRPWLAVIYSVNRAALLAGYQVSGLERLAIPEDARWLT